MSLTNYQFLGPYAAYLKHLSSTAIDTLSLMLTDRDIVGATDAGTLTALTGHLASFLPGARVLQLGTYIGWSTIVLGDLLKHQTPPGHLVTVDPDQRVLGKAQAYAGRAGLENTVTFVEGKSIDPVTIATLRLLGPFDLIYIDSSHAYHETRAELAEYLRPVWFKPNPIVMLHDAGENARAYDPTGAGGVRRALEEVFGTDPDERLRRGLSITEACDQYPNGLAVYVPRSQP